MVSIGGTRYIGGPLSPNTIGGDNYIRYIGDRLVMDFHEGAGTTVRDLSGNGNGGTFGSGAAAPTWERNRLSFDGANDYISFGNNTFNSLATDSYTINLSVEPIVLPSAGDFDRALDFEGRIAYFSADGDTAAWIFGIYNGTVLKEITSTDNYNIGESVFITGIYDKLADELRLHLNTDYKDKEVTVGTPDNSQNRNNIIGASYDPLMRNFNVYISFIHINATAFSAPQLLAEYLFLKWRT